MAAILNKHGKGKVVFGVKDDGTPLGIDIGDKTLRDISQTIASSIEPKIYPEITEKRIKGKRCVAVSFEGNQTPYFAYGRAYMRVADEDRPLSKTGLEKMILDSSAADWDSQTSSSLKISDVSEEKLRKFAKKIGLRFRTKMNSLEKLGLTEGKKPTNAAVLLFGKEPSRHFRLVMLRCAVFMGTEKTEPIDMADMKGDLFELIEKAEDYILKNIHTGMRLEGLARVDVPEINPQAIREAVINAFCHRDYSIRQEIQTAIFKDRVEILSPGNLYRGLTIKDILTRSVSERRNERIADVFHRVKYVEKWGAGIEKIKKVEPETRFEERGSFFVVTFRRKNYTRLSGEANGKKLSRSSTEQTTRKMISMMKKNKKVTIARLAEATGLSDRAIKKKIEKLKKEKLIKRVGPDRGGSWETGEKKEMIGNTSICFIGGTDTGKTRLTNTLKYALGKDAYIVTKTYTKSVKDILEQNPQVVIIGPYNISKNSNLFKDLSESNELTHKVKNSNQVKSGRYTNTVIQFIEPESIQTFKRNLKPETLERIQFFKLEPITHSDLKELRTKP